MEIWKPIKLYDHEDVQFYASSLGRIKSDPYSVVAKYGRGTYARIFEVKPTFGNFNKNRTNIKFRKKNYKVHQLICRAFHGEKPFPEAIVLHIDENYKNNKPDNLKWGSHKENARAPNLLEWHDKRPRDKGRFTSIKKETYFDSN